MKNNTVIMALPNRAIKSLAALFSRAIITVLSLVCQKKIPHFWGSYSAQTLGTGDPQKWGIFFDKPDSDFHNGPVRQSC